MNGSSYILDTSAVLTLIEDEDGADRIEALLRSEEVVLPFMVLLEMHYITRRERGEAEADRRYAMMRRLGAMIIWDVDEPTMLIASRAKALNPSVHRRCRDSSGGNQDWRRAGAQGPGVRSACWHRGTRGSALQGNSSAVGRHA